MTQEFNKNIIINQIELLDSSKFRFKETIPIYKDLKPEFSLSLDLSNNIYWSKYIFVLI